MQSGGLDSLFADVDRKRAELDASNNVWVAAAAAGA